MNEPESLVNTLFQPSLFGRDVFQITLKIGVVPETEHVQVELEAVECRSGQLVHLESHHHLSPWEAVGVVDRYYAKMAQLLHELSGPF